MAQSTPPPGREQRNGEPAVVAASNGSADAGVEFLLAEGEALRALLQEVQGRLGRLLAGLKHHRRQAKAVENALQSLRPFQRSAGGSS
jgi:hypothetical protein